MDAILFSANPAIVKVDDAIRHLAYHKELYWEVGFRVSREKFSYPIFGFIHIKGGQVEYRVAIRDIIPFSREHYEIQETAEKVKPEPWRMEWTQNINNIRSYPWQNVLVISRIEPFSFRTSTLLKCNGEPVKRPPQNYIRVILPENCEGVTFPTAETSLPITQKPHPDGRHHKPGLAEKNLEEIVVHQLEEIEPGLTLVKRQLGTAAGRLDLLCKDREGQYVVVELKRGQGIDQVVDRFSAIWGRSVRITRPKVFEGLL